MHLTRLFTSQSDAAYEDVTFEPRTSKITNPDGSVVFEASDISVPRGWSQVAVDIMAQKYFRRAGVPSRLKPVPEEGVPEWLWRSEPDLTALEALPHDQQYGGAPADVPPSAPASLQSLPDDLLRTIDNKLGL